MVHSTLPLDNSIIEQIPAYIFWKDKNSRFLGCNDKFAQIAGLIGSQDILLKTDYDLPWSDKEAGSYRKDDAIILQGNKRLNYIETQKQLDGSINQILTSKTPLLNEKQEIIGVLGIFQEVFVVSQEINIQTKYDQFNNLDKFNKLDNVIGNIISVLQKASDKNPLTRREVECLSLWIYGYSIKESACVLSVGSRTIIGYRNSIKYKLNISNKAQLTELLHNKGMFFLFLEFANKTREKYIKHKPV